MTPDECFAKAAEALDQGWGADVAREWRQLGEAIANNHRG